MRFATRRWVVLGLAVVAVFVGWVLASTNQFG